MHSKKQSVTSDFLFAKPSPLKGVARFFDFGATFDTYNRSATADEADAKAMQSDWSLVGSDIHCAMHQQDVEEEEAEKAA